MCSLPSSGCYLCTGYPVRHLLRACSACMQTLLQPQLKESAPAEQVFVQSCGKLPVQIPDTPGQIFAFFISFHLFTPQMWGEVEGSSDRWPLAMHEEWPELRHHTQPVGHPDSGAHSHNPKRHLPQ